VSTVRVAMSLLVCVILVSTAYAADPVPEERSGIEERLGEYVPLDLKLVDEAGHDVRLGDLIDRPTIVSLVYYECPSICRPLLAEVTTMLGKLIDLDMTPGEDYRVITISFDEHDGPEGSARLKKEYYSSLPDGFPAAAWTFLTGDSASIHTFTESVGFSFKRVDDDFAHPTTLVVLAPDGKITRYLIGSRYLPVDIKLALLEASEGRVGPTIAKFFQFCFSYDPEGRSYVLNITRVVGASMLIGLAGFAVFITASGKKRRTNKAG
jgi:protein SCO1/2